MAFDWELIRTERLRLRSWRAEDAPLLRDAIDSSLPELTAWLPWALEEPTPVPELAQRLQRFRLVFESGVDRLYGIFNGDESRVLGGSGIHPRVGLGGVEIGYWVRTDATGAGIAREAAKALVQVAFAALPVERVEIRMDSANARSRSIPRRLGFVHTETLRANATSPAGDARDTEVWTMQRVDYLAGIPRSTPR